jgi:hypothetical protein
LAWLRSVALQSTSADKEPVNRFAFSDIGTRSSDRQPQRNELGLRVPVTDPAIRPWRSILKMNVLSVVSGTIATISAILGLACAVCTCELSPDKFKTSN